MPYSIRDRFAFLADPRHLGILTTRPEVPQVSDAQIQPQNKGVGGHLRKRGGYPVAESDGFGVGEVVLVDALEGEIRRSADDRPSATEGRRIPCREQISLRHVRRLHISAR